MGEQTMLKFMQIMVLSCIIGCANAIGTTRINEDTKNYAVKIEYPQGLSQTVQPVIQNFISAQKNEFLKNLTNNADLPPNTPGKDTLEIQYKIVFQNKTILSILFNLSTYNKGAAHPRNSVVSFNFIGGKEVALKDLFNPGSQNLEMLSKFSQSEISKKNISEKQWIAEGTKPTNENFKIWYFTANGLAIVFDVYQVAAYVYGPQTILVPKGILMNTIKSDIAAKAWVNNE